MANIKQIGEYGTCIKEVMNMAKKEFQDMPAAMRNMEKDIISAFESQQELDKAHGVALEADSLITEQGYNTNQKVLIKLQKLKDTLEGQYASDVDMAAASFSGLIGESGSWNLKQEKIAQRATVEIENILNQIIPAKEVSINLIKICKDISELINVDMVRDKKQILDAIKAANDKYPLEFSTTQKEVLKQDAEVLTNPKAVFWARGDAWNELISLMKPFTVSKTFLGGLTRLN